MRRLAALVLLLTLSVLPPSPAIGDADAPAVFAPAGLSTDRFAAVTTPVIEEVTAHDGVALHTRVYRPGTGGELTPVILVHSPYYNGLLQGSDDRSQDIVAMFTPKGYTVVLSDVRGTGNSGGCLEQDGPNQAQDFATLVEHFAAQPWSNGRVGSYGKSYDAETQHAGAVLAPEGLVTMVSIAGISSVYDVPFFDGVPITGEGLLAFAAYELYDTDVPGSAAYYPRRAERHTCQAEHLANAASPVGTRTDWFIDRDFRRNVGDVTASMLYVTGFNDPIVRSINADGWVDQLPTFTRAVLGQWGHNYSYDAPATIARDDWYAMVHAWFDHELLDLPTGIAAWPAVQAQSEDNGWRAVDSFAGLGTPVTTSLGEGTASFAEDETLVIDGIDPPSLHLSGQAFLDATIMLDRPDGHLAVNLFEVREGGSSRRIARGYLSMVHRDSLEEMTLVPLLAPVEYHVRTYPFDVTLEEGSTVRLELSGSDGDTLPAGTGYTAGVALGSSTLTLPAADESCGLDVATRSADDLALGCAGGVPQG